MYWDIGVKSLSWLFQWYVHALCMDCPGIGALSSLSNINQSTQCFLPARAFILHAYIAVPRMAREIWSCFIGAMLHNAKHKVLPRVGRWSYRFL